MLRPMSRLRWSTAGESHGPELVAIVEGIPAGLPLLAEMIDDDLARRMRGYGRGGRMKIERDRVDIVAGVRGGETLGGPIALRIANKDFESWQGKMGAAPFASKPEALTRPRPGHADLAGGLKYDRLDLRDILERASARETAARVAVGAVARTLLAAFSIDAFAHVTRIGEVVTHTSDAPDWGAIRAAARESEMACADPAAELRMREAILAASHAGDTLGGVFEVIATGLPPGLGSHVQWDRKLDGRLAQALMSIPAIKGVEIGLGFEAARRLGSAVHDAIELDSTGAFTRPSNGAGGLEGGITNGMPLVCRAAMKPISTLRKPLASVDVRSKQVSLAAFERSDICAAPAAGVVGEAMVLICLGDAALEKFGGDSLKEMRRNWEGYARQIAAYGA